jgi:hypothetical protein
MLYNYCMYSFRLHWKLVVTAKSRIFVVVVATFTRQTSPLHFSSGTATSRIKRQEKKGKQEANMDIRSETSTILDLPPSAVAFCPSHPEFYVVGTYFLHPKEENDDSNNEEASEEAPQKRTGTLILYRLEGSVL